MKRNELLLVIALATLANSLQADHKSSFETESTSRSYLNFQPPFQTGSPEKIAGFRGLSHVKEEGKWGAIQAVVFGGRTTKSKELARYFSPVEIMADRTKIVFGADVGVQEFDILADHFNVITVNSSSLPVPDASTQFLSEVTIKPQQTTIGAGFEWRYHFWTNEEKGHCWWFSIALPIVYVRNDMNFDEKIINPGGGVATTGLPAGKVVFGSLKEAFEQEAWNFGKIKTEGSLHKTGVAELDIRLGYEWLQYDPCHLESFVGILIPTSNKPKAKYLFEPIVGNGGHFAIEWGATYSMNIWENIDREMLLTMEHSAVNKYLFQRSQIRSLDLVNKPWSRYIELYASQADAQAALDADDTLSATPGINILTQKVDVTPGYQFQLNSAFIFDWRRFTLEGGFNFLARQSERVELSNAWVESAAIKSFGGSGFTNPVRDMTGSPYIELAVTIPGAIGLTDQIIPVPVANYAQSLIKEADLDLVSASTPAVLAYTLYANLGYTFNFICWRCQEWPLLIDVGASYTFSNQNNVVDKWLVWGKLGLAF
jgi:hypothetical protein